MKLYEKIYIYIYILTIIYIHCIYCIYVSYRGFVMCVSSLISDVNCNNSLRLVYHGTILARLINEKTAPASFYNKILGL